jgi:hypothetical protein
MVKPAKRHGEFVAYLKPTDAARLRDVQLDVHFAVCNHTATSLIRGQLCTLLSCSARGDQRSAYVPSFRLTGNSKHGNSLSCIQCRTSGHSAAAADGLRR